MTFVHVMDDKPKAWQVLETRPRLENRKVATAESTPLPPKLSPIEICHLLHHHTLS